MKNEELEKLFTNNWYDEYKYYRIAGRYVINNDLENFISNLGPASKISIVGHSVEKLPVYMLTIGTGAKKVLAWSQMHGNESTTTKAVFDLINSFENSSDEVLEHILERVTLYVIPILNPDGAKAYTRVNANQVDLNRDLNNLTQPESNILMDCYRDIQPDFCLNLHDQRTIFAAGNSSTPATLSFLTPSKDPERSIDDCRKLSMGLIAGIAKDLHKLLPGQIGRYDDAFNINCAGDTFQSLGTPTILFEAGHFEEDYEREEVRKFVFWALISVLNQISSVDQLIDHYEDYFKIPENEKLLNDIIIRNVKIRGVLTDVSIQFKEVLKEGEVIFEPYIEKIAEKITNFGHREIQGKERELKIPGKTGIFENVVVNKILLNNEEIELKR